jgi:hypothetical protein
MVGFTQTEVEALMQEIGVDPDLISPDEETSPGLKAAVIVFIGKNKYRIIHLSV